MIRRNHLDVMRPSNDNHVGEATLKEQLPGRPADRNNERAGESEVSDAEFRLR